MTSSHTPALRTGPFVTGATGLIGRHLVARLLERGAGPIHVLVREGSRERFEERCRRWNAPPGRIVPVIGDLACFDVGLHLAYRLFPDSAAARGDVPVDDEKPSGLGRVFARLLPGVHW